MMYRVMRNKIAIYSYSHKEESITKENGTFPAEWGNLRGNNNKLM